MDLAQTIEFEENFRPKLESKEGLIHIKEENIDPTKNLSSVGKEIVRMDVDQTIMFEENIKPKLESKEGLLRIKEETIDSTEEKLKFLVSAEKDLSVVGKEIVQMDFAQTIEFEENIEPKLESKEGLLRIKKEKIDPIKDFSCIGKEIFEMEFHQTIEFQEDIKPKLESKEGIQMDFAQTIEFEENIEPKLESKEGLLRIKKEKIDPIKDFSCIGKEIFEMEFHQTIEFQEDIKPKLESKEGILRIKEEKIDSSEEKLKFLASGEKDLSNVGKDIVEMDFAQTIEFEEDMKPKLESKEGLLRVKDDLDSASWHPNIISDQDVQKNMVVSTEADGDDLDFSLDEEDDIPDFDEAVKPLVKNVPEVGKLSNIKTLSHTDFEKMLNAERLKNQMLQIELDQVHQDHLTKNLSQEKSLTDLKENNSILQQDISAQTEVILEKMEIIDNLNQNGANERSHLSIRRENVDLKRSIKELEAINAVQSPAAKEVRKIRNLLIAKIELNSPETDDNEHENMQKLDILSLLQKYEELKVKDAELEKLKAKIVRLKAKNKELKNKARTESLKLKK